MLNNTHILILTICCSIKIFFLGNNSCSPNYKVKLVGGQSSNEGTIQICYNGQWYSICSTTYVDRYFASTVCNQLGFVTSSCELYINAT